MNEQLLADFTAALSASAGATYVCETESLPGLLAEIGVSGTLWTSPSVPQKIRDLIRNTGIEVQDEPSPVSTRDQPWGMAIARAAIAETGSVILHENTLLERSVSLMTEALIVLCPLDRLLPSLDDAAITLREIAANGTSYATLVSGPSRTADIERQLTIGVQGPSAVHVVFLKD